MMNQITAMAIFLPALRSEINRKISLEMISPITAICSRKAVLLLSTRPKEITLTSISTSAGRNRMRIRRMLNRSEFLNAFRVRLMPNEAERIANPVRFTFASTSH